jgi:hypothetical protein
MSHFFDRKFFPLPFSTQNVFFLREGDSASVKWKWRSGAHTRKHVTHHKVDESDSSILPSVSILVQRHALECFGSIVETCDASIVSEFSQKLLDEIVKHFEFLLSNLEGGTSPFSSLIQHEIRVVSEYVTFLTVTLERAMVTSSSFPTLRSLCEDVFRRLVIPFFPWSCQLMASDQNAEEEKLKEKEIRPLLGYDEYVLSSSMVSLFTASVRHYFCCLRHETEEDAAEIGSIAKCGYFPFLFEEELDSEEEMDEEDERSFSTGKDPLHSDVTSECPTLLQVWQWVDKMSSSSSSSSLSLSSLRLRLSLLSPSLHFLQEAWKEKNEEKNTKRGKKRDEMVRAFVSILLKELRKYYPLLIDQEGSKSSGNLSSLFWATECDYSLSLWKTSLHILCSLPPLSSSLTPPPLTQNSNSIDVFGCDFHREVLQMLLDTQFGAKSFCKMIYSVGKLATETLRRSEIYEIEGIQTFLMDYLCHSMQSFVAKVS